jgi:cobyrinic acid a,c-diamide synthase
VCPTYKRTSEAVYRIGRLTASYIHLYMPSNPAAAAALFLPGAAPVALQATERGEQQPA